MKNPVLGLPQRLYWATIHLAKSLCFFIFQCWRSTQGITQRRPEWICSEARQKEYYLQPHVGTLQVNVLLQSWVSVIATWLHKVFLITNWKSWRIGDQIRSHSRSPLLLPDNSQSNLCLYSFVLLEHFKDIEPYNMWPLWLAPFTEHSVGKVHLCCSMQQHFIFYG